MQVIYKRERQREEIQCDTLLQVNAICAGKLDYTMILPSFTVFLLT